MDYYKKTTFFSRNISPCTGRLLSVKDVELSNYRFLCICMIAFCHVDAANRHGYELALARQSIAGLFHLFNAMLIVPQAIVE